MVLTYFLNDFEMVPVAPIITGITLVFPFHIRCISIVRSLYFKIFFLNHDYYYYYYYCSFNLGIFVSLVFRQLAALCSLTAVTGLQPLEPVYFNKHSSGSSFLLFLRRY
jgi:hypothetical protein